MEWIAFGTEASAGCATAAAAVAAVRLPTHDTGPKVIDPAVVAAIGAAVALLYPGARVTRIEAEP